MKERKILVIALIVLLTVCLITAVACDKEEQHDFSAEWSYDESMHWRQCQDQDCQEKFGLEEHDLQQVGTIQTCAVCGYSFNTANTYEINLQTLGGTVIAGVDVTLFDQNNQQVAKAKSNIRGKVRFTDVNPSNYVAKIDATTLPKGYYLPQEQETVELSATTMKATVKLPSALIDEEMPDGHKYALGEVMYDFKTTAIDKTGKETNISLSAYLTKYKAVVLNFWYSNCNPCLSEFPHMNEAYASYNEDITIVAISGGSKVGDSVATVENFATKNGYDFNFVNQEAMFDFTDAFGVIAYPTTVIVDRYGAVAYISTGSDTSTSSWKNLFAHYVDDDYVPNYVSGFDSEENPDGEDLTKPDVEMPESEEIASKITQVNTLTSQDTFTYSPYNDEYAWPWVFAEKDGKACLKTSNQNKLNSYSMLVIDVQLKAGQQIFADLFVSTEEDSDLLYVQVDTVLQHLLSGQDNAWRDDQLIYVAQRDGEYRIVLTYQKSLMTNAGDDTVYIKNLRIEDGAPISGAIDLLYNATDNYTLDNVTVPEANKGSLNHVEYYLNPNDGFYHVALVGNASNPSPEDPYLLANMVLTSNWNSEFSVWNLAFARVGLFDENDADYLEGCFEAVEDYSWLQNNNTSGYVPVNEELCNILKAVVDDLGRTDNSQDCHPDGTTCPKGENCHKGDDQWLEICRYYVHYGDDHTQDVENPYPKTDFCYSLDNTVEALKWRVAKDYGTMTEDVLEIDIDVYSYHIPRGNYYRFVPTKTGAYKIYSLADHGSDYDLTAQDPLGFVCDDKGNILAENDNYVIEAQGKDDDGNDLYDNNFYMYVYLQANETYYVAGCFNITDAMGAYKVRIEYLGESHTYFTSCAIDPAYTYDLDDPNFTPIIVPRMGKDRFYLGDDGIYYAQEFDGSQGSPLYIRMVGPTYYSSYTMMTLEQMIEADLVNATQSEKLYLKHMLNQARNETDETLNGYVVATERLVSILNKVVNGSDTEDSNTYSQTGWLLTAYYFCNVNELTLQQAQAKYN